MRTSSALLAACCVALTGAGCRRSQPIEKEQDGQKPLAFPVEVRPVEARRVEYEVAAVGSVEAFEVVQVTARVAGAVERVRFREGDRVRQGALLVEIEPRRFALAVRSARATLDRARATLRDAERELERAEQLHEDGVGTVAQVAAWQTRVATASAEVASARASLDLARLNLHEARVKAPIAGTLQTRGVRTGQYVQAGAVLATLVQKDPLLLRFRVAEHEAGRVRVGAPASFEVRDVNGKHGAKIRHVAAGADTASRMVEVVAEVQGDADGLRPGAFAEVSVPVGESADAAVVPETAVRSSERGFLAYVIEGGVARERVLSLGLRTADGRIEVKKGLRAGEQVVVRGAEALKEGAAVRVVVPGAASARAAAGAPPGALP